MEFRAKKEFSCGVKLLSINIDMEAYEDIFDESLSEVKTIIAKKSKDTLFIKTILLEKKVVIAQASSLWSKKSNYEK